MNESHDLPAVDRLTVGTVGPPGRRVFFLQARQGTRLVTLKVEKAQVAALSAYLGDLLASLPTPPPPADEDLELEEPVQAEWVVGAIGVSYDEEDDQVVLVVEEAQEEEEEAAATAAMARFGATRAQVAALALRGRALVTAGRPSCPICGYPLDPGGHLCPRTNGHRPPTL